MKLKPFFFEEQRRNPLDQDTNSLDFHSFFQQKKAQKSFSFSKSLSQNEVFLSEQEDYQLVDFSAPTEDVLKFCSQGNPAPIHSLAELKDFMNEDEKNTPQIIFKCKFCKRVFQNGCALGGHISKIHEGFPQIRKRQKSSVSHPIEQHRNKFLRKIQKKHSKRR